MDLQTYLTDQARLIENVLDKRLPSAGTKPEIIHEAMRYSTLGGGKRLRAILALAACEAVGGNPNQAYGFAAALEMIHAYSLIHDDLPCMDDDDFRRGKPTNHKIFGEAVAVLAGDALLTQAVSEIAHLHDTNGVDEKVALQLLREVSIACGSQGLVGGQVVDLTSSGKPIDKQTLSYIHRHKTGDLFIVALRGGALIGGATAQHLAAITSYGENFGLAFQITDDILDVVGDEAKLGKAVGADLRLDKATYPSIYGLEQSKLLAEQCVDKCQKLAESFPVKAWVLRDLARFILDREF